MKNFDVLPEYYTKDYLGSGYNASVYKLDDNNVFKKFDKPNKFEYSCEYLSNYCSDAFIYPKELVYENGRFVGYIMDYIHGNTLDKIDENENIHKYIEEVKRKEYDVAGISAHKLFAIDFKAENIIYTDDKELIFIDTDYYFKYPKKDLYQLNLTSFSFACLMPLLNIYHEDFKSKRLNHYKELVKDGRMRASRFFNEVTDEINHEVSSDIETFKDAREGLKLILK